MTTKETRKPVHEIRDGLVKAAIWQNQGKKGVWYAVTFTRLFKKDGDDAWRFTSSFGADDMHRLRNIANDAYNWIHAQARRNGQAQGEEAAAS